MGLLRGSQLIDTVQAIFDSTVCSRTQDSRTTPALVNPASSWSPIEVSGLNYHTHSVAEGILGAVVLPPRHVLLKFLVREVGLEPTTFRLYTGCSFTELLPQIQNLAGTDRFLSRTNDGPYARRSSGKLLEFWWVLLESNQVCPKASDLQSGAVASAAQNPEFGAGDGNRTRL